jgi:hypothetical protein
MQAQISSLKTNLASLGDQATHTSRELEEARANIE